MKKAAAALSLILTGCSTAPWVRAPVVDEAACTASCNSHYDQCPQVFAGFPERAAVECPAEHNNCLRACAKGRPAARAAAAPPVMAPPAPPGPASVAASASCDHAASSKEARLRELKHFYDEGLVSEDVYRDRQKAILAEP
jgi:hypothetical protein